MRQVYIFLMPDEDKNFGSFVVLNYRKAICCRAPAIPDQRDTVFVGEPEDGSLFTSIKQSIAFSI